MKVVYNNDLNFIPLKRFTATEQDVLFAICSKIRNERLKKVCFSYGELREIMKLIRKDLTNKEFTLLLQSLYKKLLQIDISWEDEQYIRGFLLFTFYEIDKKNNNVSIKLNEEYEYLVNELNSNFTEYELIEFTSISSRYAKIAYRFFKQFKGTGKVYFKIEDFRQSFDVPEGYEMCDLTRRVLQPIIDELSWYFEDLKYTKKKDGRKVTHINFTFKAQKKVQNRIVEEEENIGEVLMEEMKERRNYFRQKNLEKKEEKEKLLARKEELEKELRLLAELSTSI